MTSASPRRLPANRWASQRCPALVRRIVTATRAGLGVPIGEG